jgi:hypothetical protein
MQAGGVAANLLGPGKSRPIRAYFLLLRAATNISYIKGENAVMFVTTEESRTSTQLHCSRAR